MSAAVVICAGSLHGSGEYQIAVACLLRDRFDKQRGADGETNYAKGLHCQILADVSAMCESHCRHDKRDDE